jgi:hypothetical protein
MCAVIGRPRFTRDVNDQEVRQALNRVVAICEQPGGFRGFCSARVSDHELINIFLGQPRGRRTGPCRRAAGPRQRSRCSARR